MNWFDSLLTRLFSYLYPMTSQDNTSVVTVTNPPATDPVQAQNMPSAPVSNAEHLVAAAKDCIGQNLSEGTGVPYYVACAISVNKVHSRAFGFPIGGGASTQELYKALLKSPYFKEVQAPEPGCIVISPTGYGTNAAYPHGHVAIQCQYGLCSNDSSTGLWSENYKDIDAWIQQFGQVEGYPTYFFLRI